MLVTEKEIGGTVLALTRTGRRFYRRPTGPEDARALFKEVSDLWNGIFLPRKISMEQWKAAESVALVMTKAPGDIDVNVITPALMEEALKQVSGNRSALSASDQEQLNSFVEEEKQAEERIVPRNPDNKYLWDWTKRRLALKLPFDVPSEEEVVRKQMQLGLTRGQIEGRRAILKTIIMDEKYCASCDGKHCYMDHQRTVLERDERGAMRRVYKECRL